MQGDDRKQRIGMRAAIDWDGTAGGVSEHWTLLHATAMKGMLHHYICSASLLFLA
jgi:hypothetical protein